MAHGRAPCAITGQLVTADKLTDEDGRWLGGAAVVGSNERIGGFFIIRAHNLAEAEQIAASCPHIKHGGRIELRVIQST